MGGIESTQFGNGYIFQCVRPYHSIEASGIEWLGNAPKHWKVRRFKNILREQDSRSADGSEQLLRVSQYTGVTQRTGKNGTSEPDTRAESLVGYKRVKQDDLVINIMLAWNGSLGVSRFSGIVSPAYCVYTVKPNVDPWYVHYLLRSETYKARIRAVSTGVVDSRLRLYTDDLYRLEFLAPPFPEQRTIARFLGYVEQNIWNIISVKRKLMTLLNERKRAIVLGAVTHGLNADVHIKASGVDWLGNVPEHWDIRRLKFVAHIKTGGRDTVDRIEKGEYPFFVRSQKVERINTYSFDGEAVLTAGDGAGVAKVFHYVLGKFDFHQRVYKFSNFRRIKGRFFFYYFSNTLEFEAFRETAKSTVDSLRLPMLQNFPVVIPPVPEQDRIVEWIDRQTNPLDMVLASIKREIELLQEYRTRLINDVVTGKLDVRQTDQITFRERSAITPFEGGTLETLGETEDLSDEESENANN